MKTKNKLIEKVLSTKSDDWTYSHGFMIHNSGLEVWLSEHNNMYMGFSDPKVKLNWRQRRKLIRFFKNISTEKHINRLLRD